MKFTYTQSSLCLEQDGKRLLCSDKGAPLLYVGTGTERVEMYRGNFELEDYVTERRPLSITSAQVVPEGVLFNLQDEVTLLVAAGEDGADLSFTCLNPSINRFWFRVCAEPSEHCYGCGEQFSYFDLRGRHYPLWTGEPGLGRDPANSYLSWRYQQAEKGGGDYYTTYFPQQTYVSSRKYYVHVDSTAYADFDFRNPAFHELHFWEVPSCIHIREADSFPALSEKLSALLGRQQPLPDWVYNGLIIGVQGGAERSFGIVDRSVEHGIPVAGVWCQDWAGIRHTSFGKRLNWNWQYNNDLYPDLPGQIERLHQKGIRFLAYVSPYLAWDGPLFREADQHGVFAKRRDGSTYLVDFGEFYCGIVDLTLPNAYNWFKENIVKRNMLDIGVDGWMCDFGEYLPVDDLVLANGVSTMVEHNHWPARWAQLNFEALEECGKLGQVMYFMRAGGTGSQKYSTMLWAGDQSVDFSRHDGLCTTICAALSAGMSGYGISHSDIGGYTSMYENIRTKELFLRWAEMAVFTPLMRTHECNRPSTNFQYYDDEDCMAQFARLVRIHTLLTPCIKSLVQENADRGIPVQRPLFYHFEGDERCYTEQFEYLMGEDILVAPVYLPDQSEREVYLPEGEWIHLWSGKCHSHGTVTVDAPIGQPPVFYKKDSRWSELLRRVASC